MGPVGGRRPAGDSAPGAAASRIVAEEVRFELTGPFKESGSFQDCRHKPLAHSSKSVLSISTRKRSRWTILIFGSGPRFRTWLNILGQNQATTPSSASPNKIWRRVRDSNPRDPCRSSRFPSGCHKPLDQLSKLQDTVSPDVLVTLAGEGGFEPPLTLSESAVLPLDDSPTTWRTGWDSNPRDPFGSTPLAGEPHKPLAHRSKPSAHAGL